MNRRDFLRSLGWPVVATAGAILSAGIHESVQAGGKKKRRRRSGGGKGRKRRRSGGQSFTTGTKSETRRLKRDSKRLMEEEGVFRKRSSRKRVRGTDTGHGFSEGTIFRERSTRKPVDGSGNRQGFTNPSTNSLKRQGRQLVGDDPGSYNRRRQGFTSGTSSDTGRLKMDEPPRGAVGGNPIIGPSGAGKGKSGQNAHGLKPKRDWGHKE